MRTFNVRVAAVSLAFAALAFVGCEKETELRIYAWSDYFSPAVIKRFEKAHGCRVAIDTFDSNENMYARLKAEGNPYDLIMPSSYYVEILANDGMIVALDHAKMPNVKKNFDPAFASLMRDESFAYGVPYAVTCTGFCYDKDKVPQGADIESWSVLSNPLLKGRVTLLNDIREVIGAGLMALGYSVNSVDPAEIEAAANEVLKWKQNVRKFDAESYKTEVPAGTTWVALGYSTDTIQVILGDETEECAPRDDIGFALPKEGFSIACDELVLSAHAQQADLAYAFLDMLYTADAAKQNMEYILGPCPVKPGIDALDDGFRKLIVLPPEKLAYGQVLKTLSLTPGVKALYDEAWGKIKAAKVK